MPLLSLGALCARHWREPRLNPSGMRVVSREFAHEPFYGLGEIRCALWLSSVPYPTNQLCGIMGPVIGDLDTYCQAISRLGSCDAHAG